MAPLQSGLAVRVTTAPPVRVPFTLASFTARQSGDGVQLAWLPGDDRPVLGWHVDRVEAGGTRRPDGRRAAGRSAVRSPIAAPSTDPAARYLLTALHPWQATSRPGETQVGPAAGSRLWLQSTGPNPGARRRRAQLRVAARPGRPACACTTWRAGWCAPWSDGPAAGRRGSGCLGRSRTTMAGRWPAASISGGWRRPTAWSPPS